MGLQYTIEMMVDDTRAGMYMGEIVLVWGVCYLATWALPGWLPMRQCMLSLLTLLWLLSLACTFEDCDNGQLCSYACPFFIGSIVSEGDLLLELLGEQLEAPWTSRLLVCAHIYGNIELVWGVGRWMRWGYVAWRQLDLYLLYCRRRTAYRAVGGWLRCGSDVLRQLLGGDVSALTRVRRRLMRALISRVMALPGLLAGALASVPTRLHSEGVVLAELLGSALAALTRLCRWLIRVHWEMGRLLFHTGVVVLGLLDGALAALTRPRRRLPGAAAAAQQPPAAGTSAVSGRGGAKASGRQQRQGSQGPHGPEPVGSAASSKAASAGQAETQRARPGSSHRAER